MVEKRCFFKNAGPVWIYPILLYKGGLGNLVVVGVFVCFFVIVFFLFDFFNLFFVPLGSWCFVLKVSEGNLFYPSHLHPLVVHSESFWTHCMVDRG